MGTYGIIRNGTLAGFGINLLAGLVLWRRDDEGFSIDTLEAVWKRKDRHDETILA